MGGRAGTHGPRRSRVPRRSGPRGRLRLEHVAAATLLALLATVPSAGTAPGAAADTAAGDHHPRSQDDAPCPERGRRGPRDAPPYDTPPPLPPEAQAAVRELSEASERLPCGAVAAWIAQVRGADGGSHGGHGEQGSHGGHGDHDGAEGQEPLGPEDAAVFDRQWAAAVAAARDLATVEEATAAGYVQGSAPVPGVGSHWIDWTLIDRPFDPAHPSMLLFDGPEGEPPRLVGFSYWVRSPEPPEGFAGPDDTWHSHLGLCVINGRLYLEGVASRLSCPGNWINGSDLWMAHAWVVPEVPNPDGRFSPTNPTLTD